MKYLNVKGKVKKFHRLVKCSPGLPSLDDEGLQILFVVNDALCRTFLEISDGIVDHNLWIPVFADVDQVGILITSKQGKKYLRRRSNMCQPNRIIVYPSRSSGNMEFENQQG